MFLATVIIVLGFIGLIWGADKFAFGASALARNFGVSPLMIGLTIVAFGTSAPEIFSSAVAAYEGKPELAIGNALGSNLFNVGIALGVAAVISPLKPPESLISKELPALLLVTFVAGALLVDRHLGVFDAIVLISITGYFGYRLFRKRIRSGAVPEIEESELAEINSLQAISYLILGLALLVLSAEALVEAASNIAEQLNVSTAIIGLTVVALGTSLPELAASVTCVLKGHHDLAIGNIVGSNILNLLAVLPFPGLLAAGAIDPSLLFRDYVGVLVLTLLLSYFSYRGIKKRKMIGRLHGIIFLSIYGAWFTLMLIQTQS
ncbi:MAG: calcium/sodium antiporter [Pseudomonadales bacterium]|nr:calcium/sodium antiporter [Pseudomonadales bacterium]